jgi:hypothetical protein
VKILENSNHNINPFFTFQSLQAAQELDELNDSNSILTLAINSAVKSLEHSEASRTSWGQ